MIDGFNELNHNISNTISTIDNVARASKEQERGIMQINDAVNLLDESTQKCTSIWTNFSYGKWNSIYV